MIDIEKTGKNIRKLCEEKGVSALMIKNKLHLTTTNAVYKWFRGDNLPTIENCFELTDMLGVSIEELIVLKKLDDDK